MAKILAQAKPKPTIEIQSILISFIKNIEINPKPPENKAKACVCFLPIAFAIGVKANANGMANKLYKPNKYPVKSPASLN